MVSINKAQRVSRPLPEVECTDSDLQRRVTNYLASRFLPALKRLEVKTQDGTVILRGKLPTFHAKQIAIHSCRRVAGVRELIDEVEVS